MASGMTRISEKMIAASTELMAKKQVAKRRADAMLRCYANFDGDAEEPRGMVVSSAPRARSRPTCHGVPLCYATHPTVLHQCVRLLPFTLPHDTSALSLCLDDHNDSNYG